VAITATPIHAASEYEASRGNPCAVMDEERMSPPTALPTENPTLRTTWLKLIALEVSPSGGDGQDDGGHGGGEGPHSEAEDRHRGQDVGEAGPGEREQRERPEHHDRAARQDRRRAGRPRPREARRVREVVPPGDSSGGVTLPATKPSAENGTRTRPATKVLRPKPYPASCGVCA
jgi:hypothetical protein